MEQQKSGTQTDLIIGRNSVLEALRAGRAIDSLLVARGERSGSIGRILAECREKGIVIKEVDAKKLDFLCGRGNHQGVAAYAAAHAYACVADLLALAQQRGEAPFLIICDELEDPHNLGAIIRTAEAAGAHGVIIPKRHAASLSFAVSKAAAGALEYLPVARVGNLAATLDELKKQGLWIYGADMDGTPFCETDYSGPAALVIGSEGRGLGRLIKEKCDFIVSLPMKGKINSLNASVAAGILMYEIARQRAGLSSVRPGE
ncbi:MAG: 23S rRNA (guanosine(2251)-2'-O)-methyltransferase RlmB [Candidatus Fimivicinus sp.]|nr:23S rRNA (guanosine(2251)-2'-O)-methyltransferase RlmB [Oscillospiraceae bacterium]MDY5590054.1 23S rRNA (guanosine(2251)-2'-O)-methyltransferase RlmB [Candidatus Fimivicinus sp.]